MQPSERLVDDIDDPFDTRRRRRRAFGRVVMPVLGVAMVIAAIFSIAVYSHEANRKGVLALSDDLLATLDETIRQQVAAFLGPCARALRLSHHMLATTPLPERRSILENLSVSLLKEIPQLANVNIADADGNFVMVRRGAADGTDVKEISNAASARRVTWTHRNAAGVEIGREEDPKDTYDPRTRPWYQGAADRDGVFWSGIYIFFTDRKPGITVSTRFREANGDLRIVGIDITLEELSHFLASLEIGAHGQALIMDGSGNLVAYSDASKILKQGKDGPVPARIDEIGDPVLTATYDRFRIEGQGRHVIDVGGENYIATAAPMKEIGQDWWILITVPEADFVGFVANNNHKALAMSMVIVAFAAGLAALLIRQGLRADRAARLLLDRSRLIGRQSTAYGALAKAADQLDLAKGQVPGVFTETLTEMTGARRVSIWRLLTRTQMLHCIDSYEQDSQGHVGGLEMHRDELPQFFAFLQTGEEIDIPDAHSDRRTAQFHRVLMQPLGSRSLFVVPLRGRGQVLGAICLEDAATLEGTRDFIRTVANMLALHLAIEAGDALNGSGLDPGPRTFAAAPVPAPTAAAMERSRSADLAARSLDPAQLAAEVYTNAAVLVLRLPDSTALATRSADDAPALADAIACTLQRLAAQYDIPYLKFLGQKAVAATGFEHEDLGGTARIAGLAVDLRDHLTALFETAGLPPDFRIGIDCGLAMGGAVGNEPRVFNLWGEAVKTAGAMAASAALGGIQATEAAYDRLRQGFLFRPRGSFYLPGVGEARTFVLAGQL